MSSPVRAAPADPAHTTRVASAYDLRTEASVTCFSVHGTADPGLMPRVLELFAKRNLVPHRWHSYVSAEGADAILVMDFQVAGLSGASVTHIAACMRGLWGVSSVLTWERCGAGEI